MNNSAVVSPVPEYYAALDRIVERLGEEASGTEDREAAEDYEAARKELLLYSVSEINAYLEAVYPALEAKHRKAEPIKLAALCYSIGVMALWAIDVIVTLCRQRIFLPFVELLLIAAPLLVYYSFHSVLPHNHLRTMVLGDLVLEYARAKQVPLLVDALHFVSTRARIKQKLAALLPLYSHTDAPPLDNRLKSVLGEHLQKSFANIAKQEDSTLRDQDISFVVAVLIYFERELAQVKSVSKTVLPLLRRFAIAPASSTIPTVEWARLQSAAGDCLVRFGARR